MAPKKNSVRSKPLAYKRWAAWFMFLHWTLALFVAIAIASMLVWEWTDNRQIEALWMSVHQTSGLLAFLLFLVRCALYRRIVHPRADTRDWTDWTDWAEQGTHTLIYTLLFLLPMLGWALANANGQDVFFFGLCLFRLVHQRNADLAYTLQDFHSSAAWILMAVLILHLWSALWHYFHRRDTVLQSMLPAWLTRYLK
jgi:superoxide oxidase